MEKFPLTGAYHPPPPSNPPLCWVTMYAQVPNTFSSSPHFRSLHIFISSKKIWFFNYCWNSDRRFRWHLQNWITISTPQMLCGRNSFLYEKGKIFPCSQNEMNVSESSHKRQSMWVHGDMSLLSSSAIFLSTFFIRSYHASLVISYNPL